MRALRRFFPDIRGIGTGDPVLGTLPPNSEPLESLADGFDTHLVHRQALLKTHLCGKIQRPEAGRFAEDLRTLVQERS